MSEADSLEQILESEIDDKERLDILIYLIERTGEPEKFAQYKSEAEPLANLLQDQEAAIKIKYNEGKIWMQNQENARGMGLIQEALLEAEEIKEFHQYNYDVKNQKCHVVLIENEMTGN